MARAERLLQLANYLRSCDEVSVSQIADEMRVSRRTALRDLGTLREQGHPISGEPGPGGGVRLEGDRGVTAIHFSLSEVVAIWLAARLSREASDLPWSAAARSGLAKLLASLPRRKVRALKALCRRVIVGPPASVAVRAGAAVPPADLLGVFEEAFSTGRGLGFSYVDRSGRTSQRRAEPHGLLIETPVWYVLARDLDKNEPRMFRMDRITRPTLLRSVTFTPDTALIYAQLPDRERWCALSIR